MCSVVLYQHRTPSNFAVQVTPLGWSSLALAGASGVCASALPPPPVWQLETIRPCPWPDCAPPGFFKYKKV